MYSYPVSFIGVFNPFIFKVMIDKCIVSATFFYIFLLLFKYSCLHFHPLHLPSLHRAPSTHPSPPPTLEPTTPFGFDCVSFIHVGDPSLSPVIPLPQPLWLLSVCSLFQCLWLYFACLFVLLVRFYL